MNDDHEAWRDRAISLTAKISHDLPDRDWRAAMAILTEIGRLIGQPALGKVAMAARGAGRDCAQGLAVRRSARQQLQAVLAS